METIASTGAAPRPGIGFSAWACICSVLLFSLGSSILTPYFSMYVANQLGYGIGFAGVLVTCKVIFQRGFALPGGWIADQFGARGTAIAGVAIRGISFALLLMTPTQPGLISAACLNGIGAALFQPAIRKILLTPFRSMDAILARLAGLRSASLNLGAAIGPLVGLVLVSSRFHIACELIVAVYAANLLLLALLRMERQVTSSQPLLLHLKELARPELRPLLGMQIAFFTAYSHFEYLMPITFGKYLGEGYVALAFLVNTIVVVIAQSFVAPHAKRLTADFGLGCFCAFMLLMALIPHVDSSATATLLPGALVVLAMFLFTVGEIVLSIRIDVETAKRSTESNAGTTFGFVSFVGSLALGAANALNSVLFSRAGTSIGWFVNALVACAMLLVLLKLRKEKNNV